MKAIAPNTMHRAQSPARILILEDSLSEWQAVLDELREAGLAIEPTIVGTRREFCETMAMQLFSMAVSAHQVDTWTAVDAFEELTKKDKAPPFIVVAENLDKQEAGKYVRQGVSDCILKSDLARLPRIRAKIRSQRPITGTETVRLAEDHDSIREMVRQWLANLGYRVIAAANGEEALRLSSAERPHLAMLDVVMPKNGRARHCWRIAWAVCGFTSGADQRLFGVDRRGRDSELSLPAKTIQPHCTGAFAAEDSRFGGFSQERIRRDEYNFN